MSARYLFSIHGADGRRNILLAKSHAEVVKLFLTLSDRGIIGERRKRHAHTGQNLSRRICTEICCTKTDLIAAPGLNAESEIYLKTENLQVTGSFKVRGAYYKISQLTADEKAKGVIASSAGNHAQGVALAAQRSNIPSVICMPDGAPISKVEATKAYGAQVCLVKGAYDDAYDYACKLQKEKGYTFIHPFNDAEVIAGQGTVGLEILDQLPDVEVVLVPVGGGGLISGVAYAIKHLHPECKVYGVQAAGAPSMRDSVQKHEAITLDGVATFADGIAVKHPGDLTYELVSEYVDGIVTVTDDEIAAAVLALMERQKLVTEGAGAVSVAAACTTRWICKGKNDGSACSPAAILM